MTAPKNSEVWVVMHLDTLVEAGGIPADVIAKIDSNRRTVHAGCNDFASAIRQVEREIY